MAEAVDLNEQAIASNAVRQLLSLAGVSDREAMDVTFTRRGDVYPTPFRIGAATAAAIAAVKIAAKQVSGGLEPTVVDLALSAATTAGFRYILLDGLPVSPPRDPLTGFYLSGDNRQIFLHLNFPHHRERTLSLLKTRAEKEGVTRAVRGWSASDLEERIIAAGACAAVSMSNEEWRLTGQYAAIKDLPLISIEKVDESQPEPVTGRLPLSGLSVIDFTRVLAGPTCGKVLAELGADVTRIENPHFPDLVSYQLDANRDKRQLQIDLRKREDVGRLLRMVRQSDVFVQAYRQGVATGYGLSPDILLKMRPGLVYASLSAYGDCGPWGQRRGFDSVVQASTGLAVTQGKGQPTLLPTSPIDYISGFLLAFGINMALARRAREGGSFLVKTSLVQVADWLSSMGLQDVRSDTGDIPELIKAYTVETRTATGVVSHLRSPMIDSQGVA